MSKPHWVMDYETMVNLFVAVFEHYKSDEKKVFVIHETRDDTKEFLEFLKRTKVNNEKHISFNGLWFDSQITEKIMTIQDFNDMTLASKHNLIYWYAQEIIHGDKKWPDIPEWKLSTKQLDVYKINHWDNANKRTSLKWAQCMMDWPNVQEMPLPHDVPVYSKEDVDKVVDYCINDVQSTKKLLFLSANAVNMRKGISSKYSMKCMNYSNTKIGSELLLNMYCNITGHQKRDVKGYRTHRDAIMIKEIIFPYVKFQSIELQGFHELLKSSVITSTKKGFEYKLKYRGYTFHYGAGGIHQCIEPGIFYSDDEYIIEDADVASLYPQLACQNGMYPAHLGPEFFKIYKGAIVDVRLAEKAKPKAERDMAIVDGFKEAANASYGNSNSQYSWLYDPQYTMQTTINGQLSITMLVEDLLINIPGSVLLQTNTDGLTLRYPRKYREKYREICKKWEETTKLTLEYADYKGMFIWDVNNYIAQYDNGDTKCKGRFEWEPFTKYKHTHLHKNKSFLIVAKAIFNFFINDILPEEYLKNNRNIFDYCGFAKVKKGWEFEELTLVDGEDKREKLQKTIRYYVSNKGGKIYKKNVNDGRKIQLEAGKWVTTLYNVHEEKPHWLAYDVDDKFYLEKIYKEIEALAPKQDAQLSLNFDF